MLLVVKYAWLFDCNSGKTGSVVQS